MLPSLLLYIFLEMVEYHLVRKAPNQYLDKPTAKNYFQEHVWLPMGVEINMFRECFSLYQYTIAVSPLFRFYK
jgi:hypothetical protein